MRRVRSAFRNLLMASFFCAAPVYGLTANQVEFEFHVNFYRVIIKYTLPELKEFREAAAEFRTFSEANAFYWKLLRGAEFFIPEPGQIRFTNSTARPDPW